MKYIIISFLVLQNWFGISQTTDTTVNLIGLKISAVGASFSLIGMSMKTSATPYVQGKFGYNHLKRESPRSTVRTQATTLISGGILIVTGLIIQNIKLKKNRKR